MRRAWYAIAALLVVAGLFGLVPLVRMRVTEPGSTALASAAMHPGAAKPGPMSARGPADSATLTSASPTTAMSPGSNPFRTVPSVPARVLGPIGGKLPRQLVRPRLLVEKTGRTLTVYSAARSVKVYRVALGRFPEGDKERDGDDRTPLGRFYVCNKNAQSSFHKALGLSYPNAEDAKRGLASGLISSRQERAILEAIERGQQPPWDTKLGGLVMIHGGGTARDWTTGCVAMNNADIDELFPLIPVGTAVVIEERPARAAAQSGAQNPQRIP